MNKEHTLRLCYDGTLFESTVTYDNKTFGKVYRNYPFGWKVTFHRSVAMNCGGDCRQIISISAAMLLASTKNRRQHFIYADSPDYRPTEDEINIFLQAVRNILYYSYNYNADRFEHYANKIAAYEKVLDRKYTGRLEALQ